jgi:hypothetical protein
LNGAETSRQDTLIPDRHRRAGSRTLAAPELRVRAKPAWLPQAQADWGSCPESIEQAARDAEWAAGRAESIPRTDQKTTGLFYDSDGAEHSYTSGEKDNAAAEAVAVLKEVGAPASPLGNYPAASHVEVKAAAAMRRGEVKHGVLVINHPGGPCPGDLGCTNMLPLVLSEGTTLTVWWPSEQGMQSQQFTGGPA